MITMTTRLETRANEVIKRSNRKGTYLTHYCFYLITRVCCRQVYYIISNYFKGGDSISKTLSSIKTILYLFSAATLYVLFHTVYIFTELRVLSAHQQKTIVNRKTNLLNHLKKYWSYLSQDRTSELLLFGFLVTVNPGLGIDLISWVPNFIQKSGSYENINLVIPILTGVPYLLWITVKSRKSGIRSPNNFVLGLYGLTILIYLGIVLLRVFDIANDTTYFSLVTLNSVTNLVPTSVIIVCSYQIMKRCEEGYEAFCVNATVGIVNVAVNISNYSATVNIKDFLLRSHFSLKAILMCYALCVELAVLALLPGLYRLKMKQAPLVSRKNSGNTIKTEVCSPVTFLSSP